jgi:hypothetical protein
VLVQNGLEATELHAMDAVMLIEKLHYVENAADFGAL